VNGGFAEYVVADPNFVGHLPANIDFLEIAPILCAGVTVYKGLKVTDTKPGDWVAISGIGGLGHMAVQYAKAMGLNVAAVDIDDSKLDLARRLGATVTVNALHDDPATVIKRETGGGTNKVAHLGFDLVRANLITQGLTYGIKYAVQRNRPTGECCSFPSGHASVTFATAAVLERHLGYRASWPMFVIAGAVSASRLTDNRHYLSDVLFGSALGMAAGWTVVGRHGRDDFALFPVPLRRGVALSGTWSPNPRR